MVGREGLTIVFAVFCTDMLGDPLGAPVVGLAMRSVLSLVASSRLDEIGLIVIFRAPD